MKIEAGVDNLDSLIWHAEVVAGRIAVGMIRYGVRFERTLRERLEEQPLPDVSSAPLSLEDAAAIRRVVQKFNVPAHPSDESAPRGDQ